MKKPTKDHELTAEPITPAALIEAMADAGATYRITSGGSLIVRGIGQLPAKLQRLFLDADQRSLVAAVRAHIARREVALCNKLQGARCAAGRALDQYPSVNALDDWIARLFVFGIAPD